MDTLQLLLIIILNLLTMNSSRDDKASKYEDKYVYELLNDSVLIQTVKSSCFSVLLEYQSSNGSNSNM